MITKGFKLLCKNVLLEGSQKTEFMKKLNKFNDVPRGGIIKVTEIENPSGMKETICSVYSPFGKVQPLLQRFRFTNDEATQTIYQGIKSANGNCVKRTSRYTYNKQGELKETFTRTVDIVPATKNVTIAENRITPKQNRATELSSSIREQNNGKTVKYLKRITEYKDDNSIASDILTTKGISSYEAKQLADDIYFHGRFMAIKDFIKTFRKTFLKKQNVCSDIPMEPCWIPGSGASAMYVASMKKIFISDMSNEFRNNDIALMIEHLNHESRHAWQYELVEKLNAGKLQKTEEIALAKKFKQNIENYFQMQRGKSREDYEKYASQPIEADAFSAGEASLKEYLPFSDLWGIIFKKASPKTYGGS